MSDASGAVTVRGGAGGITANLDDLRCFARLMQSGADSIDDALEELSAPMLAWFLEVGAEHDLAGSHEIRAELAALVGPSGQLRAVHARVQSLSGLLLAGMSAYQHADDGVLATITHAFGRALIGALRVADGSFGAGTSDLFAALPGMSDLAMLFGSALEGPVSDVLPDGHAVLHDMGEDARPAAERAPHTLADLIGGLALRNSGRAGEISVSFVIGTDGHRRAIVDIPGTKSWNPVPNGNVTSVGTDVRALAGKDTAYQDGVFAAMQAAGVDPSDDVMLVGHSEGGVVAVDAAVQAAGSGRYRITHVVTAGSPIGRVAQQLPDHVQLLALENTADVVPHLDAAANPDRPNITTVTVHDQHHSITGNHDLAATYQPAAAAADDSCNASVDAFLRSAQGFLASTASATMRTHAFRITRGF